MKMKRKKLYALILMVCLMLTCFAPAPVSAKYYSRQQSYSTYSRTATRLKFDKIYYTKKQGYYYYKLVIPYNMNITISVADYTNAPFNLYAYYSYGRYSNTY